MPKTNKPRTRRVVKDKDYKPPKSLRNPNVRRRLVFDDSIVIEETPAVAQVVDDTPLVYEFSTDPYSNVVFPKRGLDQDRGYFSISGRKTVFKSDGIANGPQPFFRFEERAPLEFATCYVCHHSTDADDLKDGACENCIFFAECLDLNKPI